MANLRASALFLALALALAAAAPALAEDRFETVSGSVTAFSAARHEIAIRDDAGADRRFSWSKETKFNGVVAEGARVSVRYSHSAGAKPGDALSISVLK
jgi:hypothetical protein